MTELMQRALDALQDADIVSEDYQDVSARRSVMADLKAYLDNPEAQRQAEPYSQTALELCDKCGWKALIPGEGCLSCKREKEQEPVTQAEQEPVATVVVVYEGDHQWLTADFASTTRDSLLDGTKLYTAAPQPAQLDKDAEIVARRKASQKAFAKSVARHYASPQPAHVPEGYKLVPVEPTDEMLRVALAVQWPAMYRTHLRDPLNGPKCSENNESSISTARNAYCAMLRAAPDCP